MRLPNSTQLALFLLRSSLALFLGLWGVDKLVATDATIGIFGHFYGIDLSHGGAQIIGVLQIVLALAIGTGLWPTFTYGLGTVLHGISTASTWPQLSDPFGENHLFLAAIPVLAAFVALWLLRGKDSWLSLTGGRDST